MALSLKWGCRCVKSNFCIISDNDFALSSSDLAAGKSDVHPFAMSVIGRISVESISSSSKKNEFSFGKRSVPRSAWQPVMSFCEIRNLCWTGCSKPGGNVTSPFMLSLWLFAANTLTYVCEIRLDEMVFLPLFVRRLTLHLLMNSTLIFWLFIVIVNMGNLNSW